MPIRITPRREAEVGVRDGLKVPGPSSVPGRGRGVAGRYYSGESAPPGSQRISPTSAPWPASVRGGCAPTNSVLLDDERSASFQAVGEGSHVGSSFGGVRFQPVPAQGHRSSHAGSSMSRQSAHRVRCSGLLEAASAPGASASKLVGSPGQGLGWLNTAVAVAEFNGRDWEAVCAVRPR